ncbi:MAG: metallophosphoesterase [Gemmatimonadales bacterium]
MTLRSMLGLALALAGLAASPAEAQQTARSSRFVVLGHVRGDPNGLNPKLGELLQRARALNPDFAVLTGDIIWGDIQRPLTDPDTVEREWEQIDSAVATLGVPVYRVPGNHDIADLPSRDVYLRRYGALPKVVVEGSIRLILLNSAWMPEDGDDSSHALRVRGVDLDSAQRAWLEAELATDRGVDQTFVFLHHLLWWEPDDGRWWKEIHPLLARAGVTAVFTGDYGPLKFSALERDGVRYYQSSIEGPVSLELLRNRLPSRLLSAQLDSFIEVRVDGGSAEIFLHPVAELTSGEFTPERYRAINAPAPEPSRLERLWAAIGTPKRLGALAIGVLGLLGVGYLAGRRHAARR